jgi:hypothetical protein
VAPTHIHLLELLLYRCVVQALEHRLPIFFAYATLALADLSTTQQAQPTGAATASTVTVMSRKGGGRLCYAAVDRADGAHDSAPLGVERSAVSGISPASVVRCQGPLVLALLAIAYSCCIPCQCCCSNAHR